MNAMDFTGDVKAMGQAAVQGFEQAATTFVQMHKQGADALLQMVDFGFGAMDAVAKPGREAMVEWAKKLGGQTAVVENPMEQWEKGMAKTKEMCHEAINKWTETVATSTNMMVQGVKNAQVK